MPAQTGARVALVVEDEALIRYSLVDELTARGWVVLEAATGEGAIALAKQRPLDVLITDIELGGPVCGWDVAEAARQACPRVVVIYTSGNAPDRSRLVQDGIFIDKPVDPAHLEATCHRLCGGADV